MTRNATNAMLDDIKRTKGIASDYALAKLLEIKPQTITSYRYGRSHMSDEIAVRATRMGSPVGALPGGRCRRPSQPPRRCQGMARHREGAVAREVGAAPEIALRSSPSFMPTHRSVPLSKANLFSDASVPFP